MFKFQAVLARIQPFQRSNERSERGDHPVRLSGSHTNIDRSRYSLYDTDGAENAFFVCTGFSLKNGSFAKTGSGHTQKVSNVQRTCMEERVICQDRLWTYTHTRP